MHNIVGKYSKAVVYTDDLVLESGATAQLFDILNSKMVENESVRIMPDYHTGKDCLIGYTQTYNGGPIDPDILGVDLGCGVKSVKFKLNNDLVFSNPELIDNRIRSVIPVGLEINEKSKIDEKKFYNFLRRKLERARSLWPEMINYEYGLNEIDKVVNSILKRVGQDVGVFWESLGSMGGGNHFLEIEKEDGDNEHIWVTIHTGSRNLGIKIHSYWKKLSGKKRLISKQALKDEENRIRSTYKKDQIKSEIKKLENSDKFYNLPGKLLLSKDEISNYISDVIFAQYYAEYNRLIILERIKDICNFGKEVESIESTHNYIDPIDRIIRKGAIKSDKDQLIVIPMNMSYGVLVCKGKGNSEWNYSSPHGAGRLMSRKKSKESITMEEFKESMEGIYSSSIVEDCIDESPLAYKSPENIISNISDTADILKTLKPLLSIKGIN